MVTSGVVGPEMAKEDGRVVGDRRPRCSHLRESLTCLSSNYALPADSQGPRARQTGRTGLQSYLQMLSLL